MNYHNHAEAGSLHASASPIYAALDLGTNNCRLLVASLEPQPNSRHTNIRVLDSYSRIVRLGEGVSTTGSLSDEAMERTLTALAACQKKIARHTLHSTRFVATEACRKANNGKYFLEKAAQITGLDIEIISSEEEARLAFLGCASLLDKKEGRAIVFDIGGGSTEVMWIDTAAKGMLESPICGWLSMPLGVMNLADKYGGSLYADIAYPDMVAHITQSLSAFDAAHDISAAIAAGGVQMLSTSGTVTTLAAIHLGLLRYDRARVDGIRLDVKDVQRTIVQLLAMKLSERFNHPCIGPDRSDFIISGCAIFDAISRLWPASQITIADRGVREGIIISLAET